MFPNAPGAATHPELSALSLARMLWQAKPLIGLIAAFLSLLSLAVVYTLPARYKAEAVILVDSQNVPERYVGSTAGADVQDRLAALSQRILAADRLQKIISAYHLYDQEKARLSPEEIIERMRADTQVELERGLGQERATAFRIVYKGRDPATAADVANQIGNLFIDENFRTQEIHAQGTSEFIEAQLQQAKHTLDKLEGQVEAYKLKHQGELPEQEGSLAGAISRLQIELQANQDAIDRAGQSKALLATSLDTAESNEKALARAARRAAPATGASGRSAAALQAELDALRLRYTEQHPDVQRMEQLVAQARRAEKTSAAAVTPANTAAREVLQQREVIANLKTKLALANHEVALRNAERKGIQSRIAELQGRIAVLPVREQELAALSRDYEAARANYQSLLDKRNAAEMAADLERRQQGERFTMIDPAQPPTKPYSPDRLQLLGIFLTFSLIAAVVAGLAREIKRNVLLGEWELPPDITILGRVSAIAPAPAAQEPPVH